MSEQHERYLELCAASALGSLDQVDRRLLEDHLRTGCAECEAALNEFSDAVLLLAASSPVARPSDSLRSRILTEARQPPSPEAPTGAVLVRMRPEGRSSLIRWLPPALAAGLAVAAGAGWSQVSGLRSQLGSSNERLQQLEHKLLVSRQQLEEEQHWAAVLGSFDTCIVPLEATPDGRADLRARAIYEPGSQRAVLLVDNLRAPSGRDYQLWAIRGSAPQSLGLIKTDSSGHAVLRLEKLGTPASVNAFAISLEPEGGAPTPDKPTGPVVLVGTVPA